MEAEIYLTEHASSKIDFTYVTNAPCDMWSDANAYSLHGRLH